MSREFKIQGVNISPGEQQDLKLAVTQNYSGQEISIPLHVRRGLEPGPALLVCAAVHGDEINGTGMIQALLADENLQLRAGTLVLVPVINISGFERHSRYLSDRRDLNRFFPGVSRGSLASRYAYRVFHEVIERCDFAIDLHSAAVRRTNFPNVRADLSNPGARRLALAFGAELVVYNRGPDGSLRREASKAGCPTIVLEAGEAWKVEPGVVEMGLRGIRNILIELGMMEGEPFRPPYQAILRSTRWIRARYGGFLKFHVAPGEIVLREQPLATHTNLLGRERHVLRAPEDGVVLGMTTLPAVVPGAPVCHLALPLEGIEALQESLENAPGKSLQRRLRKDMSRSVSVHPSQS